MGSALEETSSILKTGSPAVFKGVGIGTDQGIDDISIDRACVGLRQQPTKDTIKASFTLICYPIVETESFSRTW